MTNKEILKKAIEKATGKVWKPLFSLRVRYSAWWDENKDFHNYYKLIFDHKFAEGLWGDDWFDEWQRCPSCDGSEIKCGDASDHIRAWQYHLQQLVLMEEPLKYIAKFIEE